MKKSRMILMSGLLVCALCTFAACGEDKNNAADETQMDTAAEKSDMINDADKDMVNENDTMTNDKVDNNITDNDTTGNDAAADDTGTSSEGTMTENADGTEENNGTKDNTTGTDGDGTVSGELGNTVKDIGDGVGNAVEDMGDAVGNAVDGR